MKSKTKPYLLMAFMLCLTNLFAQVDFPCATPDVYFGDESIHSKSTNIAILDDMEPQVINIFFWQLRAPDGSYNGIDFKESRLLESVAFLNKTFNKYKVFFKYRGYDGFDSPADHPWYIRQLAQVNYDVNGDGVIDENDKVLQCVEQSEPDPDGFANLGRCQITGGASFQNTLFNWVQNNGYVNEEALNVYVPYANNGGFGGAANGHGGKLNTVRYERLLTEAFAHEMGHNLNVRHTRSSSEHTTREEFLPNGNPNQDFNAKTHGDKVVDTAANSGFWFSNTATSPPSSSYPFINEETCTYIGNETDNTGAFYDIYHEDVINTMSNAYTCTENVFTDGQGIRMLEQAGSSAWSDIRASVKALYLPYKGAYYEAGPSTPDHVTLFQPGFDYQFIECEGNYPLPAPYGESFTHDQTNVISHFSKNIAPEDFNLLTHPNHTAIVIKQVDQANGVPFWFSVAQKCYDNYNRSTGGKVTRFNDNVINYNTTETTKSADEMNDENLINNLENGLYKIEKQYDNGAIKQTIVQKTGN